MASLVSKRECLCKVNRFRSLRPTKPIILDSPVIGIRPKLYLSCRKGHFIELYATRDGRFGMGSRRHGYKCRQASGAMNAEKAALNPSRHRDGAHFHFIFLFLY
ncbi:unnamed protein product [Protopolystoma xenopodis]|uniref:Uncharacterized protein n=1 Tax=Protopolystoma xenopodis TaxID=117903 RepID=A0A448XQ19_9PLAT|nr:unnamed protein product [Protopolystoma xenopodis]